MPAFLRRYQRYFLWMITIMIIISFSFFGTSGVIETPPADPIAFHTADGTAIRESQLRSMTHFLSSDIVDSRLSGGQNGNSFNDGVIARDFLETPLALQLATTYKAELQQELKTRLAKEQSQKFYHHPQAPFLSSETVWGYFIPQTTKSLSSLRSASNPLDPEAFNARIQLYTDQRAFPQHSLKRVLLHQEQQYNWLDHDANLERMDLSMFGYHTLDDWFGPQFTRLAAEFIFNSAALAEKRGYEVTQEEAMADLMQQAEKSYRQIPEAQKTAASWQIYFEQQMRRLGLDDTQLIDIWRQVLLFRRLFDGVGTALFLDPVSFEDFSRYAMTRLEALRYELPKELWIADQSLLEQFETYLDLVGERPANSPLALPTRWNSPKELAAHYPELVRKRYRVAISEANRRNLQAQVSLQEMWDWQVDSKNWAQLAQTFPEIAIATATTPEERLAVLDALPKNVSSRIDEIARTTLVSQHPEWLEKALSQAPVRTDLLLLPFKGKSEQLIGLSNSAELMKLLDNAPIGKETLSESLARYSPDGDLFYRIRLLESPSQPEIVPFGDVKNSDMLKNAVTARLEKYFLQVRERYPNLFQQSDKSWMQFDEARERVAELYFEPLFKALERVYQTAGNAATDSPTHHRLANFRLYPYVQSVAKQVKASRSQEGLWIHSKESLAQEKEVDAVPVQKQFYLNEEQISLLRRDSEGKKIEETLFSLPAGEWSTLFDNPEGLIAFFHVKESAVADTTATILEQMNHVRSYLKQEAQSLLVKNVLQTMQPKKDVPVKKTAEPVASVE